MALHLGVSRPVLREALRALQLQGVLDVRRGSRGGTYITDLEAHDDQEHSQIFEALQRRDGERAAMLAREHAEKVTRAMIKLEKQRLKA